MATATVSKRRHGKCRRTAAKQRESRQYLVVGELGYSRPCLFSGSTKDTKYPEELIDFRVSWKERASGDMLGSGSKHASKAVLTW